MILEIGLMVQLISRICSVETYSRIEMCSKDDDDLLYRWLQKKKDSTKILHILNINGSHTFQGCYTHGVLQSWKHMLRICCFNQQQLPEVLGEISVLRELQISGCAHLKSLPNSVSSLQSLKFLCIVSCRQLNDVSFVLESLKSLQYIAIIKCFGIRNWSDGAISRICSVENYSHIEICSKDDDDLLSRWLQRKIIDSRKILQYLRIDGGHGFEDYRTDYILTEPHILNICCFNQQHLPEELVHVHGLRHLDILNCPNLSCLPHGLKQPYHLQISGCPILEEHCTEQGYYLGYPDSPTSTSDFSPTSSPSAEHCTEEKADYYQHYHHSSQSSVSFEFFPRT